MNPDLQLVAFLLYRIGYWRASSETGCIGFAAFNLHEELIISSSRKWKEYPFWGCKAGIRPPHTPKMIFFQHFRELLIIENFMIETFRV